MAPWDSPDRQESSSDLKRSLSLSVPQFLISTEASGLSGGRWNLSSGRGFRRNWAGGAGGQEVQKGP